MAIDTAIDYFAQWVSYHKLNGSLTIIKLDELITNAKKLEKVQIIDAYSFGYTNGFDDAKLNIKVDDAEKYYEVIFTSTPHNENPSAT